MKNIIKTKVFYYILGVITFGSISAVFAYNLAANQVGYTPKDNTWNVSDTKEALDDLYKRYVEREVVLWTNPSPTAAFAAQTVILSDTFAKYRYIKIIYNTNPTHAQNDRLYAIYSVDQLYAYTTQPLGLGGRATHGASGVYLRAFGSPGDKKIQFGNAAMGNASDTTTGKYIVPEKILGIK
ncbi:MAG: hypothetical protein IJ572_00810 [Bacilli bacterium]|nr:hypothetical protein [Bacilli bacterium]